MERVRVYELAKQYGLTNEQMIDFLLNNDIDVASHMSTIEMPSVSKIIKKLETKQNFSEHKNRTSLKEISIEGLFDKYNYKIVFNNDGQMKN